MTLGASLLCFKRCSKILLILVVSFAAVVKAAYSSKILRIPSQQRSLLSLPFLSPSSLSITRSLNQLESHEGNVLSTLSTISSIRGGADVVAVEEDSDEDEDEDDGMEEDEDEEEEEDDEDDEEESAPSKPTQGPPIKIFIRTNLNVPLLDQTLEFTASQKRDIASIKLSISRQMLGRPPASSQTLRLGDRIVQDDELISDLLEEWEEEHDDEDDDEEEKDPLDNDDEDTVLPFVLDNPPPIDPKFATELKNQLRDVNADELLDAYAFNMAMIHRNTERMFQQTQKVSDSPTVEDDEDSEKEEEDHDEDLDDDEEMEDTSITSLTETVQLRQHAQLLREQLLSTFHEDILQKLEQIKQAAEQAKMKNDDDEDDDSITKGDVLLKQSLKSKDTGVFLGNGLVGNFQNSQKSAIKGGATMNMKRALQRNLNINWPDTVRNTFLFLFFAKFGARSATTRLFLMSMAPLCFLLQFRPIKILIKQIFYAIGKPPGILLSLLPAPQQTIMSLDVGLYMRNVYGEDDENVSTLESDEDEDESEQEEEEEEEEDDEDFDSEDDTDDESDEDFSDEDESDDE